ncbi:vesicular inhibitory amino acid transporter-like [Saccostrea echinata]|uniref:vesicular inhibitory amino acid transporter-like n=1 Tax=Saccostrea echinata TaxID=191078 RepID=UPI002A81025E|nr:vesicular inhibitory amino acid transporter-like [Saccostrea echinata]
MFIVSFPYALQQGGYWTLLAISAVAVICIHTSKIIVKCLYEDDACGNQIRVRNSYADIADRVWGARFGRYLLIFAQLIELSMTCILYILVSGELLHGCFRSHDVSLATWVILSTVPLLPCAFLRSIRCVSNLSFWCTVTHMIINAIIIVYCFTQVSQWHWDQMPVKINIWEFPISLGIVVFSYTSQIFAPKLEGNMRNPKQFKHMLYCTHISAAIFKSVFAYVCFLTWGRETMEVITNNLTQPGFKITIDLILVLKALLSFPLPYYSTVEIIEQECFNLKSPFLFSSCAGDHHALKPWTVVLRLLLVIATMLLAVFLPHFSILMGLVGSFTGTMLSFVWPCYFHLQIHGHRLLWYDKLINWVIILLGVAIGGIGMYYSGIALHHAMEGPSRANTFNSTQLSET